MEKKPTLKSKTSVEREVMKTRIRKKYGIPDDVKINTTKMAAKDDVEEFENIDAQLRPAHTKMSKAKLKWKKDKVDCPTKNDDGPVSTEVPTAEETTTEKTSKRYETVEQITRDEATSSEPDSGKMPLPSSKSKKSTSEVVRDIRKKTRKCLSDIEILLAHIDELESALQKSLDVQQQLREQLSIKDKVIKELNNIVKSQQKAAGNEEDDKISEYQRTIAKRALAIVKKHRLLENAIKDEETIILRSFFEAPEPKPNRKIVSIVDKAVEFVVYTLIIRSKELRIIEDHEMQRFLQDTDKAKRTLFSEIMANPEFLSRDWGGDQVARRIQKTLTDDKQTTESGGDEEVDVSLAKAASIIAGRLYNIPTNLHHAAVNKKTASGHTAEDERKPISSPERWIHDKAERRRKKLRAKGAVNT